MSMSVVTLQKDSSRYTFCNEVMESGEHRYSIRIERMMTTGSAASTKYTDRERGNLLYMKLIEHGFHRFRNINEVSWYATRDNNTPYEETWKIDGIYFIPVVSRVLTHCDC